MKSADEDGKGEGGISATLGAAASSPGLPVGAFAPHPNPPDPAGLSRQRFAGASARSKLTLYKRRVYTYWLCTWI